MNMYVVNMANINMLIIMYMFYLTYGIKRLLFGKIENSTVHVYQASFLGVHAQTQWSKFHDTRLIGDTRLLGTPEYATKFGVEGSSPTEGTSAELLFYLFMLLKNLSLSQN